MVSAAAQLPHNNLTTFPSESRPIFVGGRDARQAGHYHDIGGGHDSNFSAGGKAEFSDDHDIPTRCSLEIWISRE
jgi:hypothetical protein